MQPHEQRVVDEKKDLDDKLGRLAHFIILPVFETLDKVDRELLRRQRAIMAEYSTVLGERIARFATQQQTEILNPCSIL